MNSFSSISCTFIALITININSFSHMDSRFCSKPEEIEVLKGPKPKFTPVVFLGLRLTQGWVSEGNIVPFDNETMGKKDFFNQKKFDSDKDYRASIIEAVRQCVQRGMIFSPDVMKLVTTDPTFGWERTDVCTKCKGTELCGISLMCDLCDVNETHLHCLVSPMVSIPIGKWYCDECCIKTGIPIGTLLPDSEDEASPESDANIDDNEVGGARKKGKFIKDAKEKKARGRPKAAAKNTIAGMTISESIMNFIAKEDKGVSSDDRINDNELYSNLYPSVKEDDVCFVCGEGGKLILCDYPLCIRSYHHACVIKSFPHSPDYSFQDDNDVWFCPKHTCSMCSVMETMPYTVYNRTVQLPKCMMTDLSCNKSGYIASYDLVPQRELKSCTNCPFSACKDCEVALASNAGLDGSLFKFKRNLVGEKVLNCLNCYSLQSNYRLKIAKLLEATWSKIATSRLSLPFIRPLLPGVRISGGSGNGESLDLMTILENIRSFKYETIEMFTSDLAALRQLISETLKGVTPDQCVDNQNIIMNSYDTVVSNALQFLDRKKKSIQSATNGDTASGETDTMDAKTEINQEQILMNYWRCECDRGKDPVLITSRSIENWEQFLSQGQLLKHNKGKIDPYAIPPHWSDSNLQHSAVNGSQDRSAAFIQEFDDYVVDSSASGVIEAMLQLSASQSVVNGAAENSDIYKLLSRLRQLATESLQVTNIIRSKYTKEIFNLIDVDSINGINSKFELGVNKTLMQELKLVNDNLLWRLNTTNKSYEASKVVINDLVEKIRSNESKLIAITDERIVLAKQALDCMTEINKLDR